MFCDSHDEDDEPSNFVLCPKNGFVDCGAVFAAVCNSDERDLYIAEMKYVLLTNFEAVCIGRLYDEDITGDNLLEIFIDSGRESNYHVPGYRMRSSIPTKNPA